jgi:hypothetical protein
MNALTRFAIGLVGENMAVADVSSGQVTFLNASASVVWLSLSERERSESELLTLFDGMPVHGQPIRDDAVRNILREFETLGWVDKAGDGLWRMKAGSTSNLQWIESNPLANDFAGQLWSRQVRVSNTAIHLTIAAETGADEHGDFARLSGFLGGLPRDLGGRPDAALSLEIRAGGIDVRNGPKAALFKDVQTASGVLLRLAIEYSYPDAKNHTTLHAGAVCGPEGAILLPAVSGAGKTTLTGFLVARGWRYCGDDVVGVGRMGATGEIYLLPFPTALGIKDGSVEILRPFFPSLNDVSPVAYGAKSVRFFACDSGQGAIDESWRKLRALVFPTFAADANLHLEAISETDALRFILQSGWGNGVDFDRPGFELLVEAVNTLPRYRLTYSSLEAAASALEHLP